MRVYDEPTNNSTEANKAKKEYPVMFMTKDYLSNINYDNLRLHPYFNDLETSDMDISRVQSLSTIHLQPACIVAKLKELSIRAVGRACSIVAERIAMNGGVKPDVDWLQVTSRMDLRLLIYKGIALIVEI